MEIKKFQVSVILNKSGRNKTRTAMHFCAVWKITIVIMQRNRLQIACQVSTKSKLWPTKFFLITRHANLRSFRHGSSHRYNKRYNVVRFFLKMMNELHVCATARTDRLLSRRDKYFFFNSSYRFVNDSYRGEDWKRSVRLHGRIRKVTRAERDAFSFASLITIELAYSDISPTQNA